MEKSEGGGGVVIGYHLWEIDKWYEDWSFWVHC